MVPLIILRIVYHRAFIFHMLIGPGEGLTHIDFVFLRVRVKVKGSLLWEKNVSAQFLEKYLSQSFHI